jgi:predicted dithiol-disulfide oxidoreductase (DUF899 family)
MAETQFFRRWPHNASTEYISARQKLLEAEMSLRDQIERVAAQRRALPTGASMPTYSFEEGPKNLDQDHPCSETTLQQLCEGKSLVIYHLMFAEDEDEACPSCSMWIDGFNGVADHIDQHMTFVVIAKAPLPKLRSWARVRGWDKVRLLSCFGTTFNADMNLEHPDWMPGLKQAPGISVFRKDGDMVRHVYSAPPEFTPREGRAMDLLCPVWNLLDIIPEGRGEWNPSNSYIGKAPSK